MASQDMHAIMDLTARSFHFRAGLDSCVSLIARLNSYAKAPTSRKDSILKIRQDLLATHDIIELALHLRRFGEITNSTVQMKADQLLILRWSGEGKPESESASLYDVVSRLIHSKTCAVYRNLVHVFIHFGPFVPRKHVLESVIGTAAAVVLDSAKEAKVFFLLDDFLDMGLAVVEGIARNHDKRREYLTSRRF